MPERTNTCVNSDCRKQFTYMYKGGGRPPRFCPDCKRLPPEERSRRSCQLCGTPVTPTESHCEDCRNTQESSVRCRVCSKPIPDEYFDGMLKPVYCSWDCQHKENEHQPLCLRHGCDKQTPRPSVPRPYAKYCSQTCREMVWAARNPHRAISAMRVNRLYTEFIENNKPPYSLRRLPVGPGSHPLPIFCESADTGLTEDLLTDEVMTAISQWTHMVAFIYNEQLNTSLVRPNAEQALYIMTAHAHATQAWRIWPWIWENIPLTERVVLREAWTLYAKENTLGEGELAKLTARWNDLEREYEHPKPSKKIDAMRMRKRKEAITEEMLEIEWKRERPNPFIHMNPRKVAREYGGIPQAKIKYDQEARDFFEAAQSAAAPPRPSAAPVRAGRKHQSGKAAAPRR